MAAKLMKEGIFITLEGGEGCGKTTHARLLYDYLRKRSYDCVHTREPGGTKLGENIRKVLLHSKSINISDLAELFLFEACRAQIVREIIKPNLDKKRIVISDRFSDATLSYQGYGGKVELDAIRTLNRIASAGIGPRLTILLDIDTVTGLRRARGKGVDRMESKDIAYHRRVRGGYLKLAKNEPARIKVIEVKGAIGETQALIRREVELVIQKYKRAG